MRNNTILINNMEFIYNRGAAQRRLLGRRRQHALVAAPRVAAPYMIL